MPILGKLRQEDPEFEANFNYVASLRLYIYIYEMSQRNLFLFDSYGLLLD